MKKQRHNDFLQRQIADRCKEMRLFRNGTQNAMRNDLEEMNIGRIESPNSGMSIDSLAAICDYHGVTLEEFFKGILTQPTHL